MDAKKSSVSNPCLPFEIISTILLLLPPKVVAKFMCVCKSWMDLIKDPSFVNQYAKNSNKNGDGFIMYMSTHDERNMSFNLVDDKSFEEDSRLRIPSSTEWRRNLMVGSFNGVVCMSDMDNFGYNIYLCNPSIWKYRIVSSSSSSINMKLVADIVLGFGYHSQINDLKVVRIAYGEFGKFVGENIDNYYNTRVEIYSLSTNSWKEIQGISFSWFIFESSSEILLNDSLHWLAMEGGLGGGELVILSFDLREEVFKVIKMPTEYSMDEENDDLLEFIGVFDEAMSFFTYCPYKHGPARPENCDLWVMKEYANVDSWTKQYTIKVDGGVDRPLKFTNHGEILLCDDDQHVFVYNFGTQRSTYLGILASYYSFVTFTKSLTMIDEIYVPLKGVKSFPMPLPFSRQSIKM